MTTTELIMLLSLIVTIIVAITKDDKKIIASPRTVSDYF